MFEFLNLQPEVFGVDVNDSSLRIVKLKKARRGFVMMSFGETAMAPGVVKEGVIQDQAAFVKTIKKACVSIKGKPLGTKYAVVSLPEEKSFSQVIQMPTMTREELVTAVPFEAENYIPLTIDKVYLDFEVIPTHDEKSNLKHQDLLINVMPKAVVDTYVACFKEAGLVPCVMEVESQAITRALAKPDPVAPPIIFIDLGGTSTSFVLYSSDAIRFTASIPVSAGQLTEAIAKRFEIPEAKAEELKMKYGLSGKKPSGREVAVTPEAKYDIAEAMAPILIELASQINKYIAFYRDHVSHEYVESAGKIGKIVMCGGGANLKGLAEFLTKNTGITVEVGNPLANIISHHKNSSMNLSQQKALSFTTALGLAMRGADQML